MKEGAQFIPLEHIGTQDEPVIIPGTGIVIGKFYPPHKGHKYLIETAQSNCEALTVIVADKESETIPGSLRKEWIKKIHPDVMVRRLKSDGYPDNDSPLWARLTIETLGYIPEKAFTSEEYGVPWTEAMGNTHVLVDHGRFNVPISGTKVRENPAEAQQYLEPCVWSYFEERDNT